MGAILLLRNELKIPKHFMAHILRGWLIAAATVCFFWALKSLPLADAIAIFFVQPLILTIISGAFLGEKIGWHRRSAVVIGFIGALFIIRPGSETFSLAALLPLCSAFLFACYLAITRACASQDSAVMMQFISGFGALLVLTLLLALLLLFPDNPAAPKIPTSIEWIGLCAIGVVATSGHLLIVMAMHRAPASLLAPFGYVEIVAATLLGWLFFGDWPKLLTWLGIMIIIVSGCAVYARERQLRRFAQ